MHALINEKRRLKQEIDDRKAHLQIARNDIPNMLKQQDLFSQEILMSKKKQALFKSQNQDLQCNILNISQKFSEKSQEYNDSLDSLSKQHIGLKTRIKNLEHNIDYIKKRYKEN